MISWNLLKASCVPLRNSRDWTDDNCFHSPFCFLSYRLTFCYMKTFPFVSCQPQFSKSLLNVLQIQKKKKYQASFPSLHAMASLTFEVHGFLLYKSRKHSNSFPASAYPSPPNFCNLLYCQTSQTTHVHMFLEAKWIAFLPTVSSPSKTVTSK